MFHFKAGGGSHNKISCCELYWSFEMILKVSFVPSVNCSQRDQIVKHKSLCLVVKDTKKMQDIFLSMKILRSSYMGALFLRTFKMHVQTYYLHITMVLGNGRTAVVNNLASIQPDSKCKPDAHHFICVFRCAAIKILCRTLTWPQHWQPNWSPEKCACKYASSLTVCWHYSLWTFCVITSTAVALGTVHATIYYHESAISVWSPEHINVSLHSKTLNLWEMFYFNCEIDK